MERNVEGVGEGGREGGREAEREGEREVPNVKIGPRTPEIQLGS